MAYLNPHEAFTDFKDRTLESIRSMFPIKGRTQSLHLENIEVDDHLHPDDIESQHQAKIEGKSWAVPITATLSLRTPEGKKIDEKKIRIADLPKMTRRYSYIVDGQEYQVDNQWQLKPGIYARRRDNGDLEAQFNVTGRPGFRMVFDPGSKQFILEYKKAKLPVYPIIRSLGVTDDTLEQAWGKDILAANKNAKRAGTAVKQFYETSTRQAAPSMEAAEEHLAKVFRESRLRPEVTQATVGKPFEHVTGEALHLAAKKLLSVQRGAPEDDRDSLVFKSLRSLGDYVQDQVRMSSRTLQQKVQRQLNSPKGTTVRNVLYSGVFNEPILHLFHKTAIANPAKQINPLEMVSGAMQTTIMGPGGIKSSRSITDEAKMINASHLGFLDPINTPEGDKTGVTLRLPIGLKKDGDAVKVPVYDLRTGKPAHIDQTTFFTSKVVMPDQVKWENGKPKPLHDDVQVVTGHNELLKDKFSNADYVLWHPSQLFNVTSNLIPFLGNNSGGRAGMAARHMEQAISLMNRETPLVQVATPVKDKGSATFEQLVGSQTAHFAPVSGTVKKVEPTRITIAGDDGKDHAVSLYHYYPLNDAKSVLHSSPVVEPGKKVQKGDLVADTNYSKNGSLALGTNLRVAYVPYKGYNFEDGVVISEAAAKKLSSVHMQKHDLEKKDNLIFDVGQFKLRHPTAFKPDQYKAIDGEGVVKIGTKVRPGDPLIVAMQPYELKDRTGVAAFRKSLMNQHLDRSVRWDSNFEGEVVGVHKHGDKISVHVRTVEPMQVGDKIAGRYGNKGIVTKILPDHEMPHTSDGKPTEVLLNPSGVPGRMNIGQVLETSVAKIAQKTGKPYLVQNFDPSTPDYLEKVKGEMKAHGLKDTEHLVDPLTKLPLGEALVGPQYLMKLVHQVDKKLSVRSGMDLPKLPSGESYDTFLQPSGGGATGGQSIGALGMYAMLAHGAKANIREMQTWKSEGPDPQAGPTKPSQHIEVWRAIQNGTPLPPPKPTFGFHRFLEMLKGVGINVEKRGHEIMLSPMTDKQILAMSAGKLSDDIGKSPIQSKLDKSGQYAPIAGRLFDEKVTGGHGGSKWSHLELAEPLPNPLFENAIKKLTGITQTKYEDVLYGRKGVSVTGQIVSADKGITGGAGIKALLDRIDVEKELAASKKALASAPGAKADKLVKKVKYLQTLDNLKLKPSEAYVLHNLPILPPNVRPITVMQDGNPKYEDVNGLYMKFGQVNAKLKDPVLNKFLPESKKEQLRVDYYDGVKAIMGLGSVNKDKREKGLLELISGNQPKDGYFQKGLISRRQDLSMRSTIVPEPSLGLDEVGLPREAALTLFRPFVVRQLVLQGAAKNSLEAQERLAKTHQGEKDPIVWKALDHVMSERPVLLKRDPALHKYSVQAFKPRAVEGNAIKIHPLVTGGYNADFDGDTMAVYVPVSHDAVREAQKMFPSNNVFNEALGNVMYAPTLEGALGLYKLSLTGKPTDHKYVSTESVAEDLRAGKVHYSDVVQLNGKKTTPGRVLISSVLPEPMRPKVLHDFDHVINKDGLKSMLETLGKNHRADFGKVVNDIKDLGYDASYGIIRSPLVKGGNIAIGTHSLGLKDMTPDKSLRADVLSGAQKKVDAIYADPKIPKGDRDRRAVQVWLEASNAMGAQHKADAKKDPSNLFLMASAGVKPSWDQYKQMVLAPMIVLDSNNQMIPTPVTKSYAEGLDLSGYWTQLHGARRGAVMKVQEVQEPGAMSKLLMNTAMGLVVDRHDCGTHHGISLPISEADVHDRYLAKDFKAGSLHVPAGTLLDADVVGKIRAAEKNAKVVVRSSLKCESDKGICQKCMGPSVNGTPHELGTNVGVQAAQSVGERAVQLTLKSFHTGGVAEAGGGSKAINSFDRFAQLVKLPEKIPNAATLAMTSGKVEKIDHDSTGARIWVNGQSHFVGKDAKGMDLHTLLPGVTSEWKPPKVGEHIEAGDSLSDPSRTVVNPHHLYKATKSMERVQNFLTDQIHGLYKEEGVRRRGIEVMVKAMSNLTKVHDSGDHPHVLRGEFYPTSVVRKMNEDLQKHGKAPILHTPVLMGVDMLPLAINNDWMAKLQHQRLRETIEEAAAKGQVSNIHSSHPIPAAAYGAEFGLPHLARGPDGKPAAEAFQY